MTSISRVDSPRLTSSSTPARFMRPPVKPVRGAQKGHVGARKRARAGDATAPSRHGVKTYLYPYRYTKKASLKPIEPTRTGSVTDATDPTAWPPANKSAGQP